ncbi:tail fiber domain-containing protein [Meiothermus cerbereus]|uniref:tail fiber domain-containing protein n=1 Tax=Meiothermus cerbereus TaxID=65552 RepID=UPI003EEF6F70
MRKNRTKYFVLGAVVAGGLFGLGVGDLLTFKAGDPIRSSEVNANFSTLKAAVAALEAPIGVSRLAVAGTAADGKVLKLQGGNLAWADDIVGSPGTTYSADGTSLQLSGTTFSVKQGGIGTGNLSDGAVTDAKMANGTVSSAKLASSSVTTDKIADGAVAGNKIASPLVLSGSTPSIAYVMKNNDATGLGLRVDLGVQQNTFSNAAIMGQATDATAIYGFSTNGIGIRGNSNSRGVVGTLASSSCPGTYGVGGCAGNAFGVYGQSTSNDAIVGRSFSPSHAGIVGVNGSGFAAYFEAGTAVCSFKAGTTGWTCSSDENLKEDFRAVDTAKVLEAVARMPVTTWTMNGSKTRQMGPTAQDFRAAFGLGDSDKTINNTDAQGVALAAIQGLYQKNQRLEARVHQLEAQLAALHSLQAEVAALKARIKN